MFLCCLTVLGTMTTFAIPAVQEEIVQREVPQKEKVETLQLQATSLPDSNGMVIAPFVPEPSSSMQETSSATESSESSETSSMQENEGTTESSQPNSSAPAENSSQPSEGSDSSKEPAESSEPPAESSSAPVIPEIAPNAPDYQRKYPDLYVNPTEKVAPAKGDKVVYLTFDDGPSNLTPKILDILDTYEVKATFFVIGKSDEKSKDMMKEIVNRGHTIAVHTYTHDYRKIYASVDAYLDDFYKEFQLIYDATGVKPDIFRFAGGSVNGYNKKTVNAIVAEMERRGFTYYDWNASAGDAEYGATKASIYRDSVNGIKTHTRSILLCHDTNAKGDTLSQLPSIIWEAKRNGYRFEKLDASVQPIVFPLPKN